MKNMRDFKTGNREQQRGAVLIIALIMLLLLTLVGVAGMKDTQLQERMAGGTEDRAVAFQAAESALREAEALIADGDCSGTCADDGYYGDTGTPALPVREDDSGNVVSEAVFWATWFGGDADLDGIADGWVGTTTALTAMRKEYAATPFPEVASQPRYVIELLPGQYSMLPDTVNAATGTTTIKDYLITARGTGRSDTAVVILQSIYRYSVTP